MLPPSRPISSSRSSLFSRGVVQFGRLTLPAGAYEASYHSVWISTRDQRVETFRTQNIIVSAVDVNYDVRPSSKLGWGDVSL